jgi:muramidase (phage lysozyme)
MGKSMPRLAGLQPNLAAFLDAPIAWAEIGPTMLAMPETDSGYKVMVGSTPEHLILLPDYSTHPRIHNAAMNSDAAGRYQFMGIYWPYYARTLGLKDFGPESQDRWAIALIDECHARADIHAGDIETAITKCKSRWASFPGANYNQHEHTMTDLLNAYAVARAKYQGSVA